MKIITLSQKGQLLIEILLAILIAVAIIGAIANLLVLGLKSGKNSGEKNVAAALAQEGMEAIEAIQDGSWNDIYLPPDSNGNAADKGDLFPYYTYNDGLYWHLSNNSLYRDIAIDGIIYSRTVYIYNVNRDAGGNIAETGGTDDPSTQKVKIVVSYGSGSDIVFSSYLTRWKNDPFNQTDWSGSAGQSGPVSASDDVNRYDSDDGNIEIDNPSGSLRLK